jgi:enamine deaminase RidA (YjgF/YER057c/UK114 family)
VKIRINDDYAALNRGRARFYRERGIALMPASTGIGGMPLFPSQNMCLNLYAIEEGQTVHTGDFEAQAERMLLNISTLLANQKSSWHDVVSAITYLKDPFDALRLNRIFEQKGIPIFPNAIVQASVCRAELLCEMEAIAMGNAG